MYVKSNKVYKSRKPYKASKPIKKSYRKKSLSKNNLTKTIKQLIHKQIENKELTTYAANQSIGVANAGVAPAYIVLHPSIAPGTGKYQRIGNEVRIVKSQIRGFVNVVPYNVTVNLDFNDVYIKMWVCRRKDTNSTISGVPTLNDWNSFFNVNNIPVGFQGNVLDMLFYPNYEWWTVLTTKTIKLMNGNMINTANNSAGISSSNSSASIPFKFDITKYLGKCIFNDNTSTYPTNKELFLVFQAVSSGGNTLASSQFPAEYHYVIDHAYEDA